MTILFAEQKAQTIPASATDSMRSTVILIYLRDLADFT